MSNFRNNNNKFGGGNFKKNNFGGGGNFRKPRFGGSEGGQMFQAVCAECGNDCEVPFRPNGRKPVLCSNCFQKDNGRENRNDFGSEQRSFQDRNPNRRDFNERPDFRNKPPQVQGGSMPNYKRDFEALNAKLDKILRLLSPTQPEVRESIAVTPTDIEDRQPEIMIDDLDIPVIKMVEDLEMPGEEVAAPAPVAVKKKKAAPKKKAVEAKDELEAL